MSIFDESIKNDLIKNKDQFLLEFNTNRNYKSYQSQISEDYHNGYIDGVDNFVKYLLTDTVNVELLCPNINSI